MLQITDGEGKQKNRRILCGRKDNSMQSENLSGKTNEAVYKYSFLCMHLDFPLFPNSPCTDLRAGENRQHHILWLISPCHSQCSMVSEACQGFWARPVPGTRWMLQFCYVDQKNSPCGERVLKDEFILPTKKRASGEYTGCSFAYDAPIYAMHGYRAYNCALLRR